MYYLSFNSLIFLGILWSKKGTPGHITITVMVHWGLHIINTDLKALFKIQFFSLHTHTMVHSEGP